MLPLLLFGSTTHFLPLVLEQPSKPPTMSFPRLIARLPRSCASSLARAPVCARTYAASTSIPTPSAPVPASQPTAASPSDVQQAPNHAQTWSTSQAPKPGVYADVRFTQTRLDMQPAAPSAMQMVSEDPVRLVNARRATCDGGKSG